jgi:hypothetical protein
MGGGLLILPRRMLLWLLPISLRRQKTWHCRTETIALETATTGVTMNAICPGYVWTPLVEKQIPDTAKTRGITEEEVIKTRDAGPQPTSEKISLCNNRSSCRLSLIT